MDWLTKILKRSAPRGQYNGILGDEKHYTADDYAFEREEIDRAIALSIAEHDRKGKKIIDEHHDSDDSEQDEIYLRLHSEEVEKQERERKQREEEQKRAKIEEQRKLEEEKRKLEEKKRAKIEEEEKRIRVQLDEDLQLAKALQESLNDDPLPLSLPSSNPNSHPIPHLPPDNRSLFSPYPFFFPSGFRTCAGCNSEIGHGRYLSCMGAVWHPECFRCRACSHPIIDHEFSISGGRPYHKQCYKEQNHPRCDVCANFIPTNHAGLIEYRAHPFWRQKYCPAHERDSTPRCCSCERMEPRDMRYVSLDDGRKLCLECLDSSIMDTHECQPLYFEIRDFYEGLQMNVEQQIPMLLVERQALNEAMEGEKNGGHHHLPETRGLCLSEEQTISTVARRPRMGSGNRFIDMLTEPYRLIRTCEVTAILILYGLPRLLTGSILAHEMMHAWLRLRGYPNLQPEVEEGICQVMAHMWLDSETYSSPDASSASSSASKKKGKRSGMERKLGDFFKHQIEADTSAAYGDGFRMGNRAVQKYGLRATLDHIRLTGTFPV